MNAKRINDDKKYRLHEGNIKGINILQVQIPNLEKLFKQNKKNDKECLEFGLEIGTRIKKYSNTYYRNKSKIIK